MQTGHRKRLRDRFMQEGLESFTETEVLELLLFYAIPQKDVKPLAKDLLAHFGSIQKVFQAPIEALCSVKGIADHGASLISLMLPLQRYIMLHGFGERPLLNNISAIKEYCLSLLLGREKEYFYMISMDGRRQVTGTKLISEGLIDQTSASPRAVAQAALSYGAKYIILCHNHPGGTMTPSQGDIKATQGIADALNPLGIALMDHIIIAHQNAYSFYENGLLHIAQK